MQRLRIRNASDIINLKGFVAKVDPEVNLLSHIVDSYDIRPAIIKCALCGQEHMDGRIIALAGGGVTNIGNICGKKFGEKYVRALEQYRASLTLPVLRQKMIEGRSKIDSLQLQLLSLQNKTEDIAERVRRFGELFPDTYSGLRRRAIENRFEVYESIERSKDEIDDLMAANPFQNRESLKIKEAYRGTVTGHRFPDTDWSSMQSAMRLFREASEFVDLNSQQMSMPAMRRWANWLDDFDANVQGIEQSLDEGNRFFTRANFVLFALLPATGDVQARLKNFTLEELDRRMDTPAKIHQSSAVKPVGRIRTKPSQPTITARELRRLTGNKKLRI